MVSTLRGEVSPTPKWSLIQILEEGTEYGPAVLHRVCTEAANANAASNTEQRSLVAAQPCSPQGCFGS